jgi:hypothetical protein
VQCYADLDDTADAGSPRSDSPASAFSRGSSYARYVWQSDVCKFCNQVKCFGTGAHSNSGGKDKVSQQGSEDVAALATLVEVLYAQAQKASSEVRFSNHSVLYQTNRRSKSTLMLMFADPFGDGLACVIDGASCIEGILIACLSDQCRLPPFCIAAMT